jgi:general secretion pathway protein H
VRWQPTRDRPGFAFLGLPAAVTMPTQWLDERTTAEVVGAPALQLGPEPVIGAQRVRLRIEDRQLLLATDGLGPFAPVADTEAPSR